MLKIPEPHPDDIAVHLFAEKMRTRLAEKRAAGYRGWNDPNECTIERLRALYLRAVAKGDLVNVANYAMMLSQRGVEQAPAMDPVGADGTAMTSFQVFCDAEGVDAEGAYRAEIDPVFSSGFRAGLFANPYRENLATVQWGHLGSTSQYAGLKRDIAHVVKDVQCFIDEVQLSDILYTFNLHGFQVTRIPGNEQANDRPLIKGVQL